MLSLFFLELYYFSNAALLILVSNVPIFSSHIFHFFTYFFYFQKRSSTLFYHLLC